MKIKIEHTSLKHFTTLTTWGWQVYRNFEQPLTQMLIQDALQSLIIKLAKAYHRITQADRLAKPKTPNYKPKTILLNFTSAEAFTLNLIAGYWNEHLPNTVEYLVVNKAITEQLKGLA